MITTIDGNACSKLNDDCPREETIISYNIPENKCSTSPLTKKSLHEPTCPTMPEFRRPTPCSSPELRCSPPLKKEENMHCDTNNCPKKQSQCSTDGSNGQSRKTKVCFSEEFEFNDDNDVYDRSNLYKNCTRPMTIESDHCYDDRNSSCPTKPIPIHKTTCDKDDENSLSFYKDVMSNCWKNDDNFEHCRGVNGEDTNRRRIDHEAEEWSDQFRKGCSLTEQCPSQQKVIKATNNCESDCNSQNVDKGKNNCSCSKKCNTLDDCRLTKCGTEFVSQYLKTTCDNKCPFTKGGNIVKKCAACCEEGKKQCDCANDRKTIYGSVRCLRPEHPSKYCYDYGCLSSSSESLKIDDSKQRCPTTTYPYRNLQNQIDRDIKSVTTDSCCSIQKPSCSKKGINNKNESCTGDSEEWRLYNNSSCTGPLTERQTINMLDKNLRHLEFELKKVQMKQNQTMKSLSCHYVPSAGTPLPIDNIVPCNVIDASDINPAAPGGFLDDSIVALKPLVTCVPIDVLQTIKNLVENNYLRQCIKKIDEEICELEKSTKVFRYADIKDLKRKRQELENKLEPFNAQLNIKTCTPVIKKCHKNMYDCSLALFDNHLKKISVPEKIVEREMYLKNAAVQLLSWCIEQSIHAASLNEIIHHLANEKCRLKFDYNDKKQTLDKFILYVKKFLYTVKGNGDGHDRNTDYRNNNRNYGDNDKYDDTVRPCDSNCL